TVTFGAELGNIASQLGMRGHFPQVIVAAFEEDLKHWADGLTYKLSEVVASRERAAGSDTSKRLQELKRRFWPEEGKQDRITRALHVLNQPESIKLSKSDWIKIAENDIEDQI